MEKGHIYDALKVHIRAPLPDGTIEHSAMGWKEFVTACAVQANVDGLVFMQGTTKADQGNFENVTQVASIIAQNRK